MLSLEHEFPVFGAIWNADETRILTWSGGGLYVWDATTGENLLALRSGGSVSGAVWNADETEILAWDSDGMVRVWPGNVTELIAHAAARKTRDLTNRQRVEFFLPTFEPTHTPTPVMTLPGPTITPLPTLTPSITPALTAGP